MSEEFEKVKESVEEIKEEIRDELNEAAATADEGKEELKEKVEEVKAEVKDAYANVKDKAQETFKNVKESATAAYATAKEKTQATVENIKKEIDDYSGEMDPEDVSKNKVMAILAYIGVLVLVPLFCAKDSKFARFHTNQGFILFLLGLVCWLLSGVKLIGWLFYLCGIVVTILCIAGIIYAAQGRAKELPVIGNWTILK